MRIFSYERKERKQMYNHTKKRYNLEITVLNLFQIINGLTQLRYLFMARWSHYSTIILPSCIFLVTLHLKKICNSEIFLNSSLSIHFWTDLNVIFNWKNMITSWRSKIFLEINYDLKSQIGSLSCLKISGFFNISIA